MYNPVRKLSSRGHLGSLQGLCFQAAVLNLGSSETLITLFWSFILGFSSHQQFYVAVSTTLGDATSILRISHHHHLPHLRVSFLARHFAKACACIISWADSPQQPPQGRNSPNGGSSATVTWQGHGALTSIAMSQKPCHPEVRNCGSGLTFQSQAFRKGKCSFLWAPNYCARK